MLQALNTSNELWYCDTAKAQICQQKNQIYHQTQRLKSPLWLGKSVTLKQQHLDPDEVGLGDFKHSAVSSASRCVGHGAPWGMHKTGICGRDVCCGQGLCNVALGWHCKARGKHGPDITTSGGGDWKLVEVRVFWFCWNLSFVVVLLIVSTLNCIITIWSLPSWVYEIISLEFLPYPPPSVLPPSYFLQSLICTFYPWEAFQWPGV